MFTVRATKKLLDRLGVAPSSDGPPPTTALGDWYATTMSWRRQIALFVNETTYFPVFVPLTPAKSLLARFPRALSDVLLTFGVDPLFVAGEAATMTEAVVAKTADRRVLGVMKELAFMAEARVAHGFGLDDLVALSIRVADTLVSPLYKPADGPGSPDEALRRHIAALTQ
jgi:hypothetical protein